MSYPHQWCPKMLREYLCNQQAFAPDEFTRGEIRSLIDLLDPHRPLDSAGKIVEEVQRLRRQAFFDTGQAEDEIVQITAERDELRAEVERLNSDLHVCDRCGDQIAREYAGEPSELRATRCRPFRHVWQPWSGPYASGPMPGDRQQQQRCTRCGKVRTRYV